MKKYAVIVAGGNGSRMNAAIPKQFLLLKGKPILYYTISAFLNAYADIEIILVLPTHYFVKGVEIIRSYFPDKKMLHIITGGENRFTSVQHGLGLIKEESIVFVHDGVRCLLSATLIHRCYETALAAGTAIPVVNSKDSVRIVEEDQNKAIDRNSVKLIQTPQTFKSSILLPAFHVKYKEQFTDEATVVEDFGVKVTLVEGEEQNIKITHPIDLLIAEKMLEEK
ncbi:2-C-methyl-D-erythritol 4-phosphate cytidylyltransferase [Ferruginibacter albus]|uniref:2-C-methyl-D-erythritol 4-phosphate cytidylyltransferase n=1 Tax=Ferruginibacter albus TaxID=2875540 RepID=UPI001CC824BC|nr:2-C-methyl-D-erythritol 4-phosphate cytidylyltransferase [Ferruginibacter albus]UAY50832.1 2-C-methyl-D-erythritol 4-phosphate cytidylyltransferase [Ferruginibacter albus]